MTFYFFVRHQRAGIRAYYKSYASSAQIFHALFAQHVYQAWLQGRA
jgi:hypothetical protein